MSLAKYLLIMTFATLLCWGALALVVFFIDPNESGLFGIIIFYFATFFAIIGTGSLVGFLVRHIFQKKQMPFLQVKNSFRQALWFGLLVVISLFLQSQSLATWWNLVLLALVLGCVEAFWVAVNKT